MSKRGWVLRGSLIVLPLVCGCRFDTTGLAVQPDGRQVTLTDGEVRLERLDIPSAGRDSDGKAPLPESAAPACPTGCLLGCRSGTATCRELQPSNFDWPQGPPALCSLTFTISATIIVDQTTCYVVGGTPPCTGVVEVQKGSSEKACRMIVQDVMIPQGITVKVTGSYPLVLLVKSDATIQGTLDAGGKGATPGGGGGAGGTGKGQPGSGAGGGKACNCTGAYDDCGGGGGGFGSAGGDGGLEAVGGSCSISAGGATCANDDLRPLVGGSGGASGRDGDGDIPGAGGAGGGSIQISSIAGKILVAGAVTAGGGGGKGGVSGCAAGGGGGSGGAILLEAASISGGGWVAANGGGGGAGYASNNAGADGTASTTPAAGGTAAGGSGGSGAAGASAPGIGGVWDHGGGGGGGGLGRIRVNCPACSSVAQAGLQVSGAAAAGSVTAQ